MERIKEKLFISFFDIDTVYIFIFFFSCMCVPVGQSRETYVLTTENRREAEMEKDIQEQGNFLVTN